MNLESDDLTSDIKALSRACGVSTIEVEVKVGRAGGVPYWPEVEQRARWNAYSREYQRRRAQSRG